MCGSQDSSSLWCCLHSPYTLYLIYPMARGPELKSKTCLLFWSLTSLLDSDTVMYCITYRYDQRWKLWICFHISFEIAESRKGTWCFSVISGSGLFDFHSLFSFQLQSSRYGTDLSKLQVCCSSIYHHIKGNNLPVLWDSLIAQKRQSILDWRQIHLLKVSA